MYILRFLITFQGFHLDRKQSNNFKIAHRWQKRILPGSAVSFSNEAMHTTTTTVDKKTHQKTDQVAHERALHILDHTLSSSGNAAFKSREGIQKTSILSNPHFIASPIAKDSTFNTACYTLYIHGKSILLFLLSKQCYQRIQMIPSYQKNCSYK